MEASPVHRLCLAEKTKDVKEIGNARIARNVKVFVGDIREESALCRNTDFFIIELGE